MNRSMGKIIGIVVFGVMSAQAGSVNFDFRFDSDSSSFNNAAKSSGSKGSTNYIVKSGRVDFKGKINEELAYRLRWRFDKDSEVTPNKTDGLTKQVDYAFISHKLEDNLALTLGKFGSELGGFEGNTAAPDIYLQSQFYKSLATSYIYVTGAKLAYNLGDHELALLLINQSETTTTEQSKSSYGFTYKGAFMEKTLSALLSYLTDEKQSLQAPDLKKTVGISSVGMKYDPKPYFVSFDYLIFDQKNQGAANEKNATNSMVAEFGYDLDGIIPKIKYDMSENKVDNGTTTTKTKYDGVALGVEYKPIAQENFRYHLMVTQLTTKPETGDSLFEQHFIVGTRISADFLK